jgi:hypothetical protein
MLSEAGARHHSSDKKVTFEEIPLKKSQILQKANKKATMMRKSILHFNLETEMADLNDAISEDQVSSELPEEKIQKNTRRRNQVFMSGPAPQLSFLIDISQYRNREHPNRSAPGFM